MESLRKSESPGLRQNWEDENFPNFFPLKKRNLSEILRELQVFLWCLWFFHAISYPTPALKDRFFILGVLFDLHLGSTRAITRAAIHGWSLLYVFFLHLKHLTNQKSAKTNVHSKKIRPLKTIARHGVVPEHDEGQEKTKCIPFCRGSQQLGSNFFFVGHGPPSHWVSRRSGIFCQQFAKLSGHSVIMNHANPKCTVHTWVFPKIGIPQNGWFVMENPIKMDDLGVPLFSETSTYKHIHQYLSIYANTLKFWERLRFFSHFNMWKTNFTRQIRHFFCAATATNVVQDEGVVSKYMWLQTCVVDRSQIQDESSSSKSRRQA